jgi:two-component system, LytTR family, sensor kinase
MRSNAKNPEPGTSRPTPRRLFLRALLLVGFWTLLGLFFVSEAFVASTIMGRPLSWSQAVWYQLPGWYIWAALAPLVVILGRRVRIERGAWTFGLLFHATASALFSLVHLVTAVALGGLVATLARRAFSFGDVLRFLLETGSHLNLLTYWAILGVSYALDYYRRDQERELRSTVLQARLTEAQLQMLRMELHPHFLFNTLHAISALMHKDVDAADRMLARLGDLLRLTLESSGRQEVSLREELDFLRRYLEIEQARFRERLTVDMRIDPATLDARVPNLVLQPLVENAIRHGIAPRSAPGRVEIYAHRHDSMLELRVQDNGAGMRATGTQREGVGLANTRARLQQLYGASHRFELFNATEGGFVVRLSIPFSLDTRKRGQAAQT